MDFNRVRSSCAFALAGAVNTVLSRINYAWPFFEQYGAAALARELALQLGVYFLTGLCMILALGGQFSQPSQALRRPGRFLLVLAAAAAPVCWLSGSVFASVHHGQLVLRAWHLPDLLDDWLIILFWSGLFAWLYLLYLQRRESQSRLNAMLAQRAMLSRQVAQAELLAARASIDPVMVAGVLRQVQVRYACDQQRGAALLDQLVGYLRLALNRGGRHDDAAARALQALHEEAGR